MANLECPWIEEPSANVKVGPVLGAPRSVVAGLKNARVGLLGLANSHIMDHGARGLDATLGTCRRADIAAVGAGRNLEEAGRLWVSVLNGMRLGLMAVAEAELSLAGRNSAGANSMDFVRTAASLKQARSACDFLVVLVHGGNKYLEIPRLGLRSFCRLLVAEGASCAVSTFALRGHIRETRKRPDRVWSGQLRVSVPEHATNLAHRNPRSPGRGVQDTMDP